MTISFRCPQCQSPLSAPPEMAGRKAKCLKCAQVIVVPSPDRDRWPPGMEPPGMKHSSATPAAPPRKTQAVSPPATRPAAVKPAAAQQGAGSPPRAQPVAGPVAPTQPVVAAPVINVRPQSAPAIPVAKAMPVVPAATPAQRPAPKPVVPPVAETVSEDLDDLLDFELAAPALSSAKGPSDNPYQSPQAAAVDSQATSATPSEITRITYRETMSATWQIFKAQAGSLVGATLISLLAFAGASIALRFLLIGTAMVIVALDLRSTPLLYVILTLHLLGVATAATFLFLGYIRYVIQLAKGKPADLATLFSMGHLAMPGLLTLLIMLVAIVVGSMLIVGGLIAGLLFVLAPIALVERKCSAWQALTLSARVMSANFLPGFLLLFTTGMVGNVVTLLTCGLGLFAVAPFVTLLWAVIYLRATGRRTAID